MLKQKYGIILAVAVCILCCVLFASCNEQEQAPALQYKLHFNVDGQTYQTVQISGSEEVMLPKYPAKEGYSFNGWYWDEGTWENLFSADGFLDKPVDRDVTVYAKYTPIQYKLHYATAGIEHENPTAYTLEQQLVLAPAVKPGYAFEGWFTDLALTEPITQIEQGSMGDITLYAKLTPVQYTAVFKDGDTVVGEVTYTVNTKSITPPAVPEHAGYAGEWEAYELKMGGITVAAKYSAVDYKITYEDAKITEHGNKRGYCVEDQPILLTDAVREHYCFAGWYLDQSFTQRITEIAPGMTGDLVLYAKWEPVSYIATFMDGEELVAQVPYTVETESLALPELPVHAGYTGKWESYELTPGGITVNARYELATYQITYENTKDVVHNNPQTYTVASDPVVLAGLSKDGYVFDGWYLDGVSVTELPGTYAQDMVLVAGWTAIRYDMILHYNPAQGDYAKGEGNPASYTVEDGFILASLVSKIPGYVFDGWYTEKTAGRGEKVTEIQPGSMERVVLYAQYLPEQYTITYVNTEGADGTNPDRYTVLSEDFTISPILKEGYIFDGWFADAELTQPADLLIEQGSTGDLVLYAKWTPVTYTITYVLLQNAVHNNSTFYTVEDEPVALTEAILPGFTFVGWYRDDAFTQAAAYAFEKGGTGDVVLYALLIPNMNYIWLMTEESKSYTVSFDYNDGSERAVEQTVTVDKGIEPPEMPIREGYLFAGWYDSAACEGEMFDLAATVDRDLVLYAKWVEYAPNIGFGDSVKLEIDGVNEIKFVFVALADTQVILESVGDVDTCGVLYDAQGNVLATGDDADPANSNFRIVYDVTCGQVYTVAVYGYSAFAKGETTLCLIGDNTIAAGGKVASDNVYYAIGGKHFSLPIPEPRQGYAFLGWADADGVMYTDALGKSLQPWSNDSDIELFEVWEPLTEEDAQEQQPV